MQADDEYPAFKPGVRPGSLAQRLGQWPRRAWLDPGPGAGARRFPGAGGGLCLQGPGRLRPDPAGAAGFSAAAPAPGAAGAGQPGHAGARGSDGPADRPGGRGGVARGWARPWVLAWPGPPWPWRCWPRPWMGSMATSPAGMAGPAPWAPASTWRWMPCWWRGWPCCSGPWTAPGPGCWPPGPCAMSLWPRPSCGPGCVSPCHRAGADRPFAWRRF
jgi:hypothetical protein